MTRAAEYAIRNLFSQIPVSNFMVSNRDSAEAVRQMLCDRVVAELPPENPAPPRSVWRDPITDAPKDGERVLVKTNTGNVMMVNWYGPSIIHRAGIIAWCYEPA